MELNIDQIISQTMKETETMARQYMNEAIRNSQATKEQEGYHWDWEFILVLLGALGTLGLATLAFKKYWLHDNKPYDIVSTDEPDVHLNEDIELALIGNACTSS